MAGVLVSECVDGDIREIAPDFFRHIIYEGKHGSGVTAFGIVNRFAIRTLARAKPVVLRNGNDRRIRRFAQPFLDSVNHEIAKLRIGQTQLGLVRGSLAIDQAVPFGMIFEIFLRRDEWIKGVDEPFVNDFAAHSRREARAVAVVIIAHRPFAVEGRKPERLTIFKRRFLPLVQIRDPQSWLLRNLGSPGRPPTDATLFVQQPGHRVGRPARTATGQQQSLAFRANNQLFATQLFKYDIGKIFFGDRALTDNDGVIRHFSVGISHYKLCTGDLL